MMRMSSLTSKATLSVVLVMLAFVPGEGQNDQRFYIGNSRLTTSQPTFSRHSSPPMTFVESKYLRASVAKS
jgi:hypothetical protein